MHYDFQRPGKGTYLAAAAVVLLIVIGIVWGLSAASRWTSHRVLKGYQVDQ